MTRLIFGVSDLLYNSDMLLYDRNPGSLWSQILAKAVSGKFPGTRLQQLPAVHSTWGSWRRLRKFSARIPAFAATTMRVPTGATSNRPACTSESPGSHPAHTILRR